MKTYASLGILMAILLCAASCDKDRPEGGKCKKTKDCSEETCIVLECINGTCAATGNRGDGYAFDDGVQGNCAVTRCDGSGKGLSAAANDPPPPSQECMYFECVGYAPVPKYDLANSWCGVCGTCDGIGHCDEGSCKMPHPACAADADCALSPVPCAVWACVDGLCKLRPSGPETPAFDQTTGDCRAEICDADGNVVKIPEASDVPNDANDCTEDVCLGDLASHSPIPFGTPCGFDDGHACDGNGVCAVAIGGACASPEECSTGYCVDGACCDSACADVCMRCSGESSGTCAPVPKNQPDEPTCHEKNACDGGGSCKAATGQPCAKGTDCASGACDPAFMLCL